MANNKIRIGNVEVISLSDGSGDFPTGAFFPDVPETAWQGYREHLGGNGNLNPNFGCFVVRSGGRTIMVDTGYGPDAGGLPGQLKDSGVSPEEINTVTFTHLHPDHVGWNVKDGKPTFPNARYLVPKADFDFFTDAQNLENFPYIKGQVLALADMGLIDYVEPETDLTPELRVWSTPGHTPGHVSILINSGGQRGVILGDVAHSPVQAHETDWNCGFDAIPEQSRATRHSVFDRLEQEGFTIAAGHFPMPSFGKLVKVQGRRVWQAL